MSALEEIAVAPILRVEGLTTTFEMPKATLTAVDDVSFDVMPGVTVTTAFHVSKIFRKSALIAAGQPVKPATDIDFRAAFTGAGRAMKIAFLNPEIFLIARAENKAQRIDYGGFAGIVFSHQRCKPSLQGQGQPAPA